MQEIVPIAPKFDITSRISNKVNTSKNSKHQKAKCHYEVYQADVYTKPRHRPLEENNAVYPMQTYYNSPACCCPDDIVPFSKRNCDELIPQFECDIPQIECENEKRISSTVPKRIKPTMPKRISPTVSDVPMEINEPEEEPLEFMAPERENEQRRRFFQRRAYIEKRRIKPECCTKRACRRESSDCSGTSTLSSNARLTKMNMKKERRERKEKIKEEKRQLRSNIKEIKRRKKITRMKSKCTCATSLRKLNDKCCTTSTDLVYNPRLLKCQGTTTSPPKRAPRLRPPRRQRSPQRKQRSPQRQRPKSPPKPRQRSPQQKRLKNTEDKFTCCTCKRPFVEDALPLLQNADEQEDIIEDSAPEQEEIKPVEYPRKSTVFERQEERKSTVYQKKSTVFEHQGQQTEFDTQPYYQQLILNRNINIYLQIEKFCKQKPILLSRRQYDKVKKALDGKMGPSKSWKGRRPNNCCSCSLGDVREKDGENEINEAKILQANVCTLNREEQASQNTSWLFTSKNEAVQKVYSMTTAQIKSTAVSPKQSLIQQIYQEAGPATESNKIKALTNIKQHTKKTQYRVPEPIRHTQNVINYIKKGEKSSGLKCAQCGRKTLDISNCSSCKKKDFKARYETQRHYMANDNFCNICRMVQDLEGNIIYPMEKRKSSTRRAASSAEIHYANVNTEKRVTFSSSYLDGNFVNQASNHLLLKKHSSNSLYTLFKGR